MTQSRMLTLAQWSAISGIPSTPSIKLDPDNAHVESTVSVIINHTDYSRRQGLWFLSDYVVSSSDGTIVWLAPHKQPDDLESISRDLRMTTLRCVAGVLHDRIEEVGIEELSYSENRIMGILRGVGIEI